MNRQFIRLTVKFDNHKTATKFLIPVDVIMLVKEDKSLIGGVEITWLDGEHKTITHFQEDVNTVYHRLHGSEH